MQYSNKYDDSINIEKIGRGERTDNLIFHYRNILTAMKK